MTGNISNKNQKLIAINGAADHIHILIGMKPSCCLSDLIKEVKKSSNAFVKEKRFTKFKFNTMKNIYLNGLMIYKPDLKEIICIAKVNTANLIRPFLFPAGKIRSYPTLEAFRAT